LDKVKLNENPNIPTKGDVVEGGEKSKAGG